MAIAEDRDATVESFHCTPEARPYAANSETVVANLSR